MKECFSCGAKLEDEDVYEVKGKIFCDDCAMGQQKVLQTCDPGAVHSALLDRKKSGFTGTEGLTEIQKEIYLFIQEKNGVTVPQLIEKFKLTAEEAGAATTVLRHLELGKGQKREDGVYFVPWEA
ncbi:hypothetical protein [Acetobacterium tundrae]|uniref:LIM zinc-binding domain-containing protein n=1 Tax=Acetobacterium tundrae TaxID=132932 RepID=A0ABR6WH34_9FIRM|nr:hypothetical protein [Acetobacterium tundrae]MBC3795767.1 hypothetical protein [Acetobacterium tundrae]